jgi:ABC-type branched-subunit amino acid transport system substrate-binding protein
MNRFAKNLVGWGAATVAVFSLAACGSKSEDTSNAGAAAPATTAAAGGTTPASVKTGPGVTASTISLGVLTDLSGPFAPLTSVITHGNQAYWKSRNTTGGVCGRQVNLVIKDHGYDTQKAVVEYREVGPKVAALQQLVGSPMTAALLPSLKTDQMLSILASWPTSLLPNDFIIETGSTYEVEMINGLGYLKDKGLIKAGGKVGALYFEGEYGEAGLAGSKAFAKANGMTVVEQKIQPTDEDMSGQVAAFKRAGVSVIAVTTSPTAMASVAGIAASQGLNVPIIGNNPTFDPALMKTPAAGALKKNAFVVASIAPINSKLPKVQKIAKEYKAAYPKDTPKNAAVLGFAQAKVMYSILDKACSDGDLSREGIVKASRELSDVATSGMLASKLDFTQLGKPSSRAVYIARPADVTGGLTQVGGVLESDEAKAFGG